MADALTIDATSILKGAAQVKSLSVLLSQRLDDVLTAGASDIATEAKTRAPKDIGGLASSINVDNSKPLEKHVTVNAFYAPFVEFGTGKYAAQTVSGLPADWQAFAGQFKGKKGGGNLDEFLANMMAWVKRKGIHGKTAGGRSKTGKKADADIYNIAYVMTISILRNGIHAHPFLFPAYDNNRKQIMDDVEKVLKDL